MAGNANNVWVQLTNNDGRRYYWNRRSGDTQWDAPEIDPEGTPELPVVFWEQIKDPKTEKNFYHNLVTGERVWELPALAPEEVPPQQAGLQPQGTPELQQQSPQSLPSNAPNSEAEATHGDPAKSWVAVEPDGGFWNYCLGVSLKQLPPGVKPTWSAFHDADDGRYYIFDGGSGSVDNLRPGSAVWEIPDRLQKTLTQELNAARQHWWLEIGSAVAVTGLTRQRKFNGVTGTIIDCDAHCRFHVQLPELLGGPVLALRPKNIAQLPEQSLVEFVGLSQEELNGDTGVVTGVDESKQRYIVRPRDTSSKSPFISVRPTKLKSRSRLWDIDMHVECKQLQWRQEKRCLFIDKSGIWRYYELQLPLGFEKRSIEPDPRSSMTPKSWPLLVYLHGHGGGSFFTQSRKSMKSGGMQLAAERFVVISPVCEWGWRESPHPWIIELLQELSAAEWIDERRIYLTGCSMGGMGTWEVASMAPELFAAIAPVAAHHKQELEAKIAYFLQGVPVYVIHSDGDDTCLISKEEPLWALFQGSENTFHKKILRGVDHCSIAEEAYCNTISLYQFLLDRQTAVDN